MAATAPVTTETQFYMLCTEDDLIDLTAGYVSQSVKAMACSMLDFALQDERKAAANRARDRHARRRAAARKGQPDGE